MQQNKPGAEPDLSWDLSRSSTGRWFAGLWVSAALGSPGYFQGGGFGHANELLFP